MTALSAGDLSTALACALEKVISAAFLDGALGRGRSEETDAAIDAVFDLFFAQTSTHAPALSAAEAEAMVDDLDNAARHRGHMDHEMFADSGRAASAANVAAARAALIAALTGREGGAS